MVFFAGKPPNITLRILSRIEQPFVMYKKQKDGEEVLVGNDRFEVLFLSFFLSFSNFLLINYSFCPFLKDDL